MDFDDESALLMADNQPEVTDLYPTTDITLVVQHRLPRQAARPPLGAQRVNRTITKRKRYNTKSDTPVPQYLSKDWVEWKDETTMNCSEDVKRMRTGSLPDSSSTKATPLFSQGSERIGTQSSVPEVVYSNSVVAETPSSMRLETANALIGKGNRERRGSGPMHWKVLEEGVRVDAEHNDTRRFLGEAETLPDDLKVDSTASEREAVDMLVPKIEPGLGDDDMLEIHGGLLGRIRRTSDAGRSLPTTAKRPRGRPRKHPLPMVGENLNKLGKGRSKTGCITCRKRKKKCDEAKPHCLNCEKNAVLCEGYQPLTTWRSGKEKAASEGTDRDRSGSSIPHSPASVFASFSYGTPSLSLSPVIHGIETESDRSFFSHYCHRLSSVLTVEEPEYNAFKVQLLPMAVQHIGLMHSILALSASNIDWTSPYGIELLEKHKDLSIRDLEDRAQYHNDAALRELHRDMNLQKELEERGEAPDSSIIKVRFGQMLCFVIKSLAEGNTDGAHRMHLQAYEKLARESPPKDCPFMNFIHDYFKYHVCFDQLVGPPNAYPVLTEDEFWTRPATQMTIEPAPLSLTDASQNEQIISSRSGGLFGLQQDIYDSFMRRIGKIRHDIRERMEKKLEPHVNYAALHQAAALDAEIKSWADAPPPPAWTPEETSIQKRRREKEEALFRTGLLYKQMFWVYLWRTIYPPSAINTPPKFSRFPPSNASPGSHDPSANTLAYDPRIKHAVDQAIALLQSFRPQDPCQTMLLSPAFLIGCAAFEDEQRKAIRKVVKDVKNYTTLRNADPALRVLEEVWKRMDGRGDSGALGMKGVLRNSRGEWDGGRESSWDWQGIARDLKVDFLAT